MIDAEFKSEERYIRFSIAYEGNEEKEYVHTCIENIICNYKITPEQHTTPILHNREVLVTEYNDEDPREVARIFDQVMKKLNITTCI